MIPKKYLLFRNSLTVEPVAKTSKDDCKNSTQILHLVAVAVVHSNAEKFYDWEFDHVVVWVE